eukprot:scaffold230623_cov57-Attheya_sp.AAC.2
MQKKCAGKTLEEAQVGETTGRRKTGRLCVTRLGIARVSLLWPVSAVLLVSLTMTQRRSPTTRYLSISLAVALLTSRLGK